MEKSPSEEEFLGKRKIDQEAPENENDELKKFKVDDSASSSEKGNEDRTEDGIEVTISGNSTKQNLSEEDLIKNLFDDTLDTIRSKIIVEDKNVQSAYYEIKEKVTNKFHFNKTDFNRSENLIAYFYAYPPFLTVVSRDRFLDAFKNCLQLQESVTKDYLKILSLGGGPGTDIIAFCSALQDFLKQQETENHCNMIKKLNITVVDKWKRWESFYHVMEFLVREGDYGNVSTIYKSKDICSSFLVIDLLNQEQPKKFVDELDTADIVLLVRVLDSLDFKETNPIQLLRKYLSRMKSGALLLVVDTVIKYYNGQEATEIYSSNLGYYEMDLKLEKFGIEESKSSKPFVLILKKK